MQQLSSSFTLTNGSVLKNRLAKSAMSENNAVNNAPGKEIINLYRIWAKGGCGLIITGNIMVDSQALGQPKNIVVEDESQLADLTKWANVIKGTNAHIWPQLNHPGRQAFAGINQRLVSPSAVRVNLANEKIFSTPQPLTEVEIVAIIKRFGKTAAILKKAGFTGVQIHGAHGYLISQFLSPLTNLREDQWGGSLENRARFVLEIYREIRKSVGADFPIGIKLNSADFQRGGFTEEESMEVVKMLSKEGIDLIEISGGSYEKAAMMGTLKKQSSREREVYFLDYIEKVRKITKTPLMLTGGFRTVSVMEKCLKNKVLDIVGMARPYSIYPNLANQILNEGRLDVHLEKYPFEFQRKMDILFHESYLKKLARGEKTRIETSPFFALKTLFIMIKSSLKK